MFSVDLNNINHHIANHDEDDPESDFWVGIINLKNGNHLKKS